MKIYILRHEERTIDASFFSPLTKQGILNAINLISILENLNITKIICSPFIRTMQTIIPYSRKKNIKLNLEYGLIEILHPSIIPPKSFNVELPEYLAEEFNYNKDYIPFIKPQNLVYPEDDSMLEKRTKLILNKIIANNYKSKDNILIVTHQGLCKNILKILNEKSTIKPNKEDYDNYMTGKITLIFDEYKWSYKKIN